MDHPPPNLTPIYLTIMVVVSIAEMTSDRPPQKPQWQHDGIITSSLPGLRYNVFFVVFMTSYISKKMPMAIINKFCILLASQMTCQHVVDWSSQRPPKLI
ncbi:hypothetical protein MtrunA17_Chr8g0337091 [Medicago truncatula]|uniref:Transmembrane protein, putative n=1 Tax=Medicago truncatula TaxID=3880 RepID=G7LDH7_MEDTR|nr:transmembrane protein, putative [Medicago truncatula]RHN38801.1 hypothetical protein MtrunA17_Chr8g0337091 [Medicago truncatula]